MFELLAIAVLLILLCLSLKTASANERLVITHDKRVKRVSGPGIAFILPFLEHSTKIDLTSNVYNIPEIRFDDLSQLKLVTGTYECSIFEPVRAAAQANLRHATDSAVKQALENLLRSATIEMCLGDQTILQSLAIEAVNKKTGTLGVKVSAILFKEFPSHKQMIFTISTLLTLPAAQVRSIAEQISPQSIS